VRKEVAMTGEITLRGKVLPIGGVKEKVLAAHRVGIKIIILPRENEKDLSDIPQEIQKELQFHLVETMDEVLKVALEREMPPVPSRKEGYDKGIDKNISDSSVAH
jgi:ATP-dependent Lon protease